MHFVTKAFVFLASLFQQPLFNGFEILPGRHPLHVILDAEFLGEGSGYGKLFLGGENASTDPARFAMEATTCSVWLRSWTRSGMP